MIILDKMFVYYKSNVHYEGDHYKIPRKLYHEQSFKGKIVFWSELHTFPVNLSFAEFNTPVSTSLTKFNVWGKVTTVKGPWRTLIMVANPGITKPVSRSQCSRNIGSADCFLYPFTHTLCVYSERRKWNTYCKQTLHVVYN